MTTELTYSLETLRFLFQNHHVFALWSTAFALALLLRLLQQKIKHPSLVPAFFTAVPGVFYLIVWIAGFKWDMLRATGWVFPMPEGDAPGWQFYSYFGKTLFWHVVDTKSRGALRARYLTGALNLSDPPPFFLQI